MANTAERLAREYLRGLKKVMAEEYADEYPEGLKALESALGASKEDLQRLRVSRPKCPEALTALLRLVDGTYWRTYGDMEVAEYMFGSNLSGEEDGEWYPYYLLSSAQIAEGHDFDESIEAIWGDFDIEVDARIRKDVDMSRRLHFADCMNNGGTSRLFIDFDPAPGGCEGQVVRFLHDPDSFEVIAESFADFLRDNMENGYPFIVGDLV